MHAPRQGTVDGHQLGGHAASRACCWVEGCNSPWGRAQANHAIAVGRRANRSRDVDAVRDDPDARRHGGAGPAARPPARDVGFHGLSVRPCERVPVIPRIENAGVLVRPMTMPPSVAGPDLRAILRGDQVAELRDAVVVGRPKSIGVDLGGGG